MFFNHIIPTSIEKKNDMHEKYTIHDEQGMVIAVIYLMWEI